MVGRYLLLAKACIYASCLLPLVTVACIEWNKGVVPIAPPTLAALALAGAAGAVALMSLRRWVGIGILGGAGLLYAVLSMLAAKGALPPGIAQIAWPELIVLGVLLADAAAAMHLWLNAREAEIVLLSEAQGAALDSLAPARRDLVIFGAAAASLFLELAVIRWQTTAAAFFSFYKNFGLLACFAGLGLGYALSASRHIPLALSAPLLALQFALLIVLPHALPAAAFNSIMVSPIPEQLNMGYGSASSAAHYVAVYSLLGAIFLMTAGAFIPIGQVCGRAMAGRPSLRAYGLNLLGSLAGVLAMHALSFLWTPPLVWFAAGLAALAAFQAHSARALALAGGFAAVSVALLAWPVSVFSEKIYSPYQLLERVQGPRGEISIVAAGNYYQKMLDLSAENSNREKDPFLRETALYYELPYAVHGAAKTVAIVGAGSGNDVAAALRSGAERVDAIEIDPGILALGRIYHPERPYSDPRARTIVNDARTFLRRSRDQYDVIAYGLLDSHSLLSHASSVRVDSFVYTVEGLKEARARLAPGGILSLSFCLLSPEMGRKIHLMMAEAFDGNAPACLVGDYDESMTFLQSREGELAGQTARLQAAGIPETKRFALSYLAADLSTDDWPFFYMPRRVYPGSYLGVLALLSALSLAMIGAFAARGPRGNDLAFFFLGAGFMLVETKAITELGLVFGNTWQVIGIAIAGVLAMAFLANALVGWFSIQKVWPAFALLFAALALGYVIAGMAPFPPTLWGRAAAVAVLTSPLFFSGIVFSRLLAAEPEASGALSANLFGAMCGGLLEYNSMYFGFRFLYLLGIALYAAAFAATFFRAGSRREAA